MSHTACEAWHFGLDIFFPPPCEFLRKRRQALLIFVTSAVVFLSVGSVRFLYLYPVKPLLKLQIPGSWPYLIRISRNGDQESSF